EDAGYEIRDTLMWLYGSGFPKSADVSKHIDKAAGAERALGDVKVYGGGHRADRLDPGGKTMAEGWSRPWQDEPDAMQRRTHESLPATPEAEQWQGWGTALKPAYEPIIMARKSFKGNVAANVLQHGTGAINVDASRIAAPDGITSGGKPTDTNNPMY